MLLNQTQVDRSHSMESSSKLDIRCKTSREAMELLKVQTDSVYI